MLLVRAHQIKCTVGMLNADEFVSLLPNPPTHSRRETIARGTANDERGWWTSWASEERVG